MVSLVGRTTITLLVEKASVVPWAYVRLDGKDEPQTGPRVDDLSRNPGGSKGVRASAQKAKGIKP